jgi:hypothetical protein
MVVMKYTYWKPYLDLAQRSNKLLHELFGWDGPMTHRQFLLMQQFQQESWNSPNRTDHYLMAIAREIQTCLTKSNNTNLDNYRIKFELKTGPSSTNKPLKPVNPNWIMTPEKIAKAKREAAIRRVELAALAAKSSSNQS